MSATLAQAPLATAPSQYDGQRPQFTCLACGVAFFEPDVQRAHFASDWHRYNMKRRVASLPPVSADSFNAKVIERREQTAIRPDPKGMTCDACRKVFTTENSYRSHVASKKHRLVEAKYNAAGPSRSQKMSTDAVTDDKVDDEADAHSEPEKENDEVESYQPEPAKSSVPARLLVDEDATEEDIEMSIDAKIAAARQQIPPTACLFCTVKSSSIEENLRHMSSTHSFFIPDREYLVDLPGLLGYLGEKIAIGNTCLYCPNGGKDFTSTEAVRAHMRDKAHCKIAYDTEADKMEIVDFYDFEASYPDADERRARRAAREEKRRRREARQRAREEKDREEGWEEVDDAEDGMVQDVPDEEEEVVVIEESDDESSSEEGEETDSELEDYNGISLAADGLSLRLPDGRMLGHRSLKMYYDQKLRPLPEPGSENVDNPSSAVALKLRNVKQKLADPTQALIPVSGGSGGYGKGLQVMNARNAGEAKWAKTIAKQNRDVRVREQQRTRVAIKVHNNQKHYRDPLLQ